jgi:isoleucyl-tRNA synthetase
VGNVVAPQKVSDTLGAEILRLWVASTDYAGELSISDEILKRVVESYRRIRNTIRFLLANLSDFQSATDAVALEDLLEIDQYALAMTADVQRGVLAQYEKYEFHPAMSRLQTFCSEDLGAFYLDVLKDRLYTSAPHSHARRSAQTALLHITQALLKMLAPVLSFTAEEAWAVLKQDTLGPMDEASQITIFAQCYYPLPEPTQPTELTQKWFRVREIRAEVLKTLEVLRANGQIGSSLQAEVTIYASAADHDLLTSLGEQLKFLLIVSAATTKLDQAGLRIEATPSEKPKCARCWHYVDDVGQHADHPEICGRCIDNLSLAQ